MTCRDCQMSLLQLLDPSAPSGDVSAHLGDCQVCQRYHQRLVRIEANVARMPVPSSSGLETLKHTLLTPALPRPIVGKIAVHQPGRSPMGKRGWLAVGLAAA